MIVAYNHACIIVISIIYANLVYAGNDDHDADINMVALVTNIELQNLGYCIQLGE